MNTYYVIERKYCSEWEKYQEFQDFQLAKDRINHLRETSYFIFRLIKIEEIY